MYLPARNEISEDTLFSLFSHLSRSRQTNIEVNQELQPGDPMLHPHGKLVTRKASHIVLHLLTHKLGSRWTKSDFEKKKKKRCPTQQQARNDALLVPRTVFLLSSTRRQWSSGSLYEICKAENSKTQPRAYFSSNESQVHCMHLDVVETPRCSSRVVKSVLTGDELQYSGAVADGLPAVKVDFLQHSINSIKQPDEAILIEQAR